MEPQTETTKESNDGAGGATNGHAPPPDKGDEVARAEAAGKRVLTLPTAALKRIKDEQRQRGERAALASFESKVKAAGFAGLDDLLATASEWKRTGAGKGKAAPPPERPGREPEAERRGAGDERPRDGFRTEGERRHVEREVRRLREERERLVGQARDERERRRALQQQLDAKEAEIALRELAVRAGVRDVDYALRLAQRELEGKDEKAIEAFDEAKFFEGLHETHPYLFGEVTRPATTGTGAGTNPPAAPKIAAATGKGPMEDARKLSREEYAAFLRSQGLELPAP